MDKKKYYSWILYDWANSAYATIVLAGFFPIIFAEYYAANFQETTRTLILGIANSSASLILIVFAPILGIIADRKNNRKLFLIFFALLGILSTFLLSFAGQDNWALASVFFSISLLGFILEKFPFFKVNSGLKVNELIVLILSFLKMFIISFKIAASPSLELLIILDM